ncbi:hypothetical protein CRENPOLYSF2_3610003 [Crenothrix polyspora]|uniref:Uncharacterized protein n=1 Tax=Crenothrix polyspora TaxID=360316 RepID=A0A1R4HC06_9GAMM|nr:hypothetical protein [Crenothrix polyspora]SJM93792.1 hypothetical protein CRENPOLYSF2_3610003 [Crenothrix polyspora]
MKKSLIRIFDALFFNKLKTAKSIFSQPLSGNGSANSETLDSIIIQASYLLITSSTNLTKAGLNNVNPNMAIPTNIFNHNVFCLGNP